MLELLVERNPIGNDDRSTRRASLQALRHETESFLPSVIQVFCSKHATVVARNADVSEIAQRIHIVVLSEVGVKVS